MRHQLGSCRIVVNKDLDALFSSNRFFLCSSNASSPSIFLTAESDLPRANDICYEDYQDAPTVHPPRSTHQSLAIQGKLRNLFPRLVGIFHLLKRDEGLSSHTLIPMSDDG